MFTSCPIVLQNFFSYIFHMTLCLDAAQGAIDSTAVRTIKPDPPDGDECLARRMMAL